MYLTFPTKNQVHVHDDRTGRVITSNSVPGPIESGFFNDTATTEIYTDKQVIVYRKRPGSPSFSQVQWRPR